MNKTYELFKVWALDIITNTHVYCNLIKEHGSILYSHICDRWINICIDVYRYILKPY